MEEDQITIVPTRQRKIKGKVDINIEQCKGCELCTIECKEGALAIGTAINKKGYRYIVSNNNLCTGCTNCALICPNAIISVYRTRVRRRQQNGGTSTGETIPLLLNNE